MSTLGFPPAPAGTGGHPGLRRLAGGVLALIAGSGLALAVPASPAYAHAQLVGTSPANGQRLATSPTEVVLRFSERVDLVGDGVRLLGPDGPVAGLGPARIDPATPAEVRLPVPAPLADGVYTVSWRVVSADSHPLHGAFVFGVGDVTVSPLPGAGAVTDADPALAVVFWLFRWLGYAALALLAGGVCFVLLCWPAGRAQHRARRIVVAGWGGSVASALAVLLLQGPYAAGGSLARAADPTLLAATLGADYGRYVLARLGLLAIGAALVLGAVRIPARQRQLGAGAAAVLAGALPASWVGTGHANGQASLLAAAADTGHLSAMAIWLGGLVVLLLCVLPRTSDRPLAEVARAVTRFSSIATVCVGALLVTGGYQAWRGVGSLDELSGSTYGTLLVFKLGGVGLLLWLGAMSRAVVRRRYLHPALAAAAESSRTSPTGTGTADPAPASAEGGAGARKPSTTTAGQATAARRTAAGKSTAAPGPGATSRRRSTVAAAANRTAGKSTVAAAAAGTKARESARAAVTGRSGRSGRRAARAGQRQELTAREQLRWSVRAEVVIVLAVLALTAMLVATPPAALPEPGETQAAPARVVSAELTLADGRVEVRCEPASVGPNSLTLTVRRADGTAWDVPEVRAALTLPEQGLGPVPVPLTRLAAGQYSSPAVTIPTPGRWRLNVTVRTSDIDQTTVGTDLTVS